ncbi:phospholipase D-like domain-containing protein [Evansella halocellulosilytica]|uniref:phospholipase D-like domain-containing protein n=1 Tax=Evansella halocellulosilytica TaxID=2011013 RepID=UPI000BB99B28|nr:phospholipase D family protein [Evansella halocellulosilytica]
MRKANRMMKVIIGIVIAYALYAFIFGVLLFNFHQPSISSEEKQNERLYEERSSTDRVVLIEDRMDAAIARINLIENAETSLDIAYYTTHSGKASDVFFASIIDAADRGVQVRVLLDGLFHNLRGENRDIISAFAFHPNVELKLYEPLDVLRPWSWNNRLHDKMMIVDHDLAIIGGRNIGDSYFASEGYDGAKNDRDVIIVNANEKKKDTVIHDMHQYFQHVWSHNYSKRPKMLETNRQLNRGEKATSELRTFLEQYQMNNNELFQQDINWLDESIPTNRVSFIHNPIERLNKEPIVWGEVVNLIESAEKSIVLQSPYIIPTPKMMQYMNKENVSAEDIVMITNSLAASPNVIAQSGYTIHREDIANSNVKLYEFQGPAESLHTKTFIFDDRISVIGTFNFDSRSTFLNTESVVVIDSEEFAAKVNSEIDEVLERGSLLVDGDGSYYQNPYVIEAEVSRIKEWITSGLSFFTRYFQHLLLIKF